MKILVIAAHPDDEVLGCGGTIARLANEGQEVFIVILGEGITSRYDNREYAVEELVKNLQVTSRNVAKFLGAKDVFMYDFVDNRFDTVPLLDIVKPIEGIINKIKPTMIFTQHGGDLNIDHSLTFRATLTAARPVQGCSVREIYAYEVASSTEWSFGQFEPVFKPNTFIDIQETLDLKIQALKMYEDEVRQHPHPRSAEAVEAISRKWGSTAGMEAAEAFQLVRLLR